MPPVTATLWNDAGYKEFRVTVTDAEDRTVFSHVVGINPDDFLSSQAETHEVMARCTEETERELDLAQTANP
jgi:hypothetical protein